MVGRGQERFAQKQGRGDERLLAESRQLYDLLRDGHDRLRYHVSRTFARRDAATKRPIFASEVEEGRWQPARDQHPSGELTDRQLNPYVLRKHLLGDYDVAAESPSWTSLIVFDIDRHLPEDLDEASAPIEMVRAANERRDEVLAALWRAFGFSGEKCPVILQSPGKGYHVYLPLCRERGGEGERTWPAAWARELVEHELNQQGIDLRPGELELFPSGARLRAPCGRGMVLVEPLRPDEPADLGLEPVPGTCGSQIDRRRLEFRRVRKIGPMVGAFLEAVERARRPLEEWLGITPQWDEVWGPWGEKNESSTSRGNALSRHNVEVKRGRVPGAPFVFSSVFQIPFSRSGSDSGEAFAGGSGGGDTPDVVQVGRLLYGVAFTKRIAELAELGLTYAGERHDAALKLSWYWGVCRGLGREEVLCRLKEWLEAHDHASNLLPGNPGKFVRDTLREAAHYFDRHVAPAQTGRGGKGIDLALRPLAEKDRRPLELVDPRVRKQAEMILRYLKGFKNGSGAGLVPHAVNLSGKVLEALCGDSRVHVEVDGVVKRRRAYVVAIEELTRLGVLALHTDYSTGNHGRLHTCWYRFGSGRVATNNAAGELVLARREIESGTLEVVANGKEVPRVALRPTLEAIASAASTSAKSSWWVRMYERRAFTPAEFLEADERKVIPGPFRHRFSKSPGRKPRRRGRAARLAVVPTREGSLLPRPASTIGGAFPPMDSLERAIEKAWSAWNHAFEDG
jgi:hypothetical protein